MQRIAVLLSIGAMIFIYVLFSTANKYGEIFVTMMKEMAIIDLFQR